MQYTFSSDRPSDLKEEVVVCFVPEMKAVAGPFLKSLDEASARLLSQAWLRRNSSAKAESSCRSRIRKVGRPPRDSGRSGRCPEGECGFVPSRHGRAVASKSDLTSAGNRPVFRDKSDESFCQAAVEGYLLGHTNSASTRPVKPLRTKPVSPACVFVSDGPLRSGRRSGRAGEVSSSPRDSFWCAIWPIRPQPI